MRYTPLINIVLFIHLKISIISAGKPVNRFKPVRKRFRKFSKRRMNRRQLPLSQMAPMQTLWKKDLPWWTILRVIRRFEICG